MSDGFTPSVTPPQRLTEPALWFAFRKSEILVLNGTSRPELPCSMSLEEHGLAPQRHQYLGLFRGRHCFAAEVHESQPLPDGWSFLGLRDLFGLTEGVLAALSGRAYQILEWDRNHQYCSRCGTPNVRRTDERARRCSGCGFTSYPPVTPAIMILVTRGRELLLARKPIWPDGRYSALAGFVEPGETLEDTIRRETREEVGVEVKNIRYFGSQPWPFPHSLMVAFTAEHAGGEIRPDGVEIVEARWFKPDKLPNLPPPVSISRQLIDAIAGKLARGEGPG
ncbi:MAG: NAD(+) diphosphatase [Gammaproteobacteria bacterium]|nr:NAD(+) diphosphatase [Gammaproteobacteria bacterium]